jgi:hypothetical protein
MNGIGLGKSISTKKQLDRFAELQYSQGMGRAYLAEMAKMAYNGKGKWGLALGALAQSSINNIIRISFIPLYCTRSLDHSSTSSLSC